jgi:hypothetical protein
LTREYEFHEDVNRGRCIAVGGPDENAEEKQLWRMLSEAGLAEIRLEEFADRIRDVKRTVIVRLRELMEFNSGAQERESAAHSLGTLKRLESKVQANAPKTFDPSGK